MLVKFGNIHVKWTLILVSDILLYLLVEVGSLQSVFLNKVSVLLPSLLIPLGYNLSAFNTSLKLHLLLLNVCTAYGLGAPIYQSCLFLYPCWYLYWGGRTFSWHSCRLVYKLDIDCIPVHWLDLHVLRYLLLNHLLKKI